MNILDTGIIEKLNHIAEFLAYRNIASLYPEELCKKIGSTKVDLLILLGNSVLYTIELAARSYQGGVCEKVMIVGGIGHATEYLRENIKKEKEFNLFKTEDRSEATMIFQILTDFYGIPDRDIIIEGNSTNCGANAIEALRVLKNSSFKPSNIILMQDPTMQLRTYASFEKSWKDENESACLLSYAPFIPMLVIKDNELTFEDSVQGIWSLDRYIALIMGEIPRLLDNESGYGPRGKNFIGHVDVPEDILEAYNYLMEKLNSGLINRSLRLGS